MFLCWNGALLCKNHHLLWLNHSYNATLLYMVIYNMNHKWLSTNCKYYLSNNFDVMIKLISVLDFIRNFMIKNEVKDFFLPQSMDNTKFGIFVLNLVSRVQKKHLFYHLATGYNAPFCTLWYKIWIRGECPPWLDSNFCIPFELSNEVFFQG